MVRGLQDMVLVDHSQDVWQHLIAAAASERDVVVVDLVLDNAGFELVADLALVEFLVSSGLADRVRLRVKCQPWFVSDTMEVDLDWTLQQMEGGQLAQAAKEVLYPCPVLTLTRHQKRLNDMND